MVRGKGTKKKSREHAPVYNPCKGEDYEKWRKKLVMWGLLTSLTTKEKGPAVYEALEGRAESAVFLMDIDLINSENGLNLILERLDTLFMPDAFERTY